MLNCSRPSRNRSHTSVNQAHDSRATIASVRSFSANSRPPCGPATTPWSPRQRPHPSHQVEPEQWRACHIGHAEQQHGAAWIACSDHLRAPSFWGSGWLERPCRIVRRRNEHRRSCGWSCAGGCDAHPPVTVVSLPGLGGRRPPAGPVFEEGVEEVVPSDRRIDRPLLRNDRLRTAGVRHTWPTGCQCPYRRRPDAWTDVRHGHFAVPLVAGSDSRSATLSGERDGPARTRAGRNLAGPQCVPGPSASASIGSPTCAS